MNMTGQPSTVSLDLPPVLASILSMGTTATQPAAMTPPAAGLSGGMMGMQSSVPSYQAGGMVGPGGMPEPMGMPGGGMPGAGMPEPTSAGLAPQGQSAQPMDPQMLEMQINQFASQRPQQVQQLQQAIQEALQSGELTPQELNMIVQLATVAAQNPQMYPYVRRFAIQQGLAAEADLPQQYDQGLVFALLLVGRAMQQVVGGGGGAPTMGGGPDVTASQVSSGAMPSMAKGGTVPQSKKSDGSVLINAHEGEYVIPRRVVEMKGKEFFDNLVEKYRDQA